ncbi:MAG: META domain-containing protein [Paracoccaceae bacterium]
MFRLFLTIPFLLAACLNDETVSGFADTQATYHLEEMNGVAFGARATISFPEQGLIRGRAPCNSYSAEQRAPYPWLEMGPIAATRALCADFPAETRFFNALTAMTQIEVLGDLLILRSDTGAEMVFRSR